MVIEYGPQTPFEPDDGDRLNLNRQFTFDRDAVVADMRKWAELYGGDEHVMTVYDSQHPRGRP